MIFQIDGNLGATAAIAEMFVQSEDEKIYLLPALPDEWDEGEVEGLWLPGQITLSMAWKKKKPEKIRLLAKKDVVKQLIYEEKSIEVKLNAGETINVEL